MTPRKHISKAVRREVARRQHGCDPETGLVLLGTAELDHFVPLGLLGDNDVDNLMWRNKEQHTAKTAKDIRQIRKSDRQRKAWLGIKKRRGPKLQGRPFGPSPGFDKRYRKRMDGTVEVRT